MYEGVVFFLLRNQVFCAHTQMEVEHAMWRIGKASNKMMYYHIGDGQFFTLSPFAVIIYQGPLTSVGPH